MTIFKVNKVCVKCGTTWLGNSLKPLQPGEKVREAHCDRCLDEEDRPLAKATPTRTVPDLVPPMRTAE